MVVIDLPIDALSFWILMIVSFLPLLVLGLSSVYTRFYRRYAETKHSLLEPENFPFPVRMYGASIRTIYRSLCAYLGSLAFMFGLPALVLILFYPIDFVEYMKDLPFWLVFWCVSILIFVGSVSPDSTGGLGSNIKPESHPKEDGPFA